MKQFLKLTAKSDGSKFLLDVADIKSIGNDDAGENSTLIEVYSSDDNFYCKESVEQIASAFHSFDGLMVEVRSAQ